MKQLIICGTAMMIAGAVSVYAADAKANWTRHCAKCHGEDGKGQNVMGKKLGVKDFTDAKVQEAIKDDAMLKAVKEGMKDKNGKVVMKGFADALSEDEIKEMAKHIRGFRK
jgi:cytochrome c553